MAGYDSNILILLDKMFRAGDGRSAAIAAKLPAAADFAGLFTPH
jgi:hypothetical protein